MARKDAIVVLQYVDAFIKSRLELVKFNYAVALPAGPQGVHYRPVKVYEYMPDREKNETLYPSIAFVRAHVEHRPISFRAGHEVFIPSSTEISVDIPQIMGGGVATGPDGFTRKPYPTPINLYYKMFTLATDKAQHDWLTEMMFQLFPPGFQSQIPDIDQSQYGLFIFEKVLGMDELEKPVFSSAYVLAVLDLWLDRIEHYTSTPTTDVEFNITTA